MDRRRYLRVVGAVTFALGGCMDTRSYVSFPAESTSEADVQAAFESCER